MHKNATKLQSLHVQSEVFRKILDGEKRQEVLTWLMNMQGYSYDWAEKRYHEVVKKMNEIRDQKAGNVVKLHLERYEELYKKSVDWGLDMKAMQILKAKETLVGLIKDAVNIEGAEINKNTLIIGTSTHDFTRLDKEGNIRLVSLLDKIGLDGDKKLGN